jgi:hypothetical protein
MMAQRPGMPGGGEDGPMAGMAGAGSMVRPHDIVIELRGTIALATPPNPEALGLAAEGAGDAGGDAADPVPVADTPPAQEAEPAAVDPADAGPAARGDAPAEPAAVEGGNEPPPAADAPPAEGAPPADGAAPPPGDAPPPADQPPPAEPAV